MTDDFEKHRWREQEARAAFWSRKLKENLFFAAPELHLSKIVEVLLQVQEEAFAAGLVAGLKEGE
jgi:hypothetical protein